MTCVRNNCNVKYVDENQEYKCIHCPGGPVFHEGYKFWSCCDKKKHYDFDSFLEAPGCETVTGCKWFKEASDELKAKQCRYARASTSSLPESRRAVCVCLVCIIASGCKPPTTWVLPKCSTSMSRLGAWRLANSSAMSHIFLVILSMAMLGLAGGQVRLLSDAVDDRRDRVRKAV